jgi:hypothetical protein
MTRHVSASIPEDLAVWIGHRAWSENRSMSKMIVVLLQEARKARDAAQSA